jgi:hypothetical protein
MRHKVEHAAVADKARQKLGAGPCFPNRGQGRQTYDLQLKAFVILRIPPTNGCILLKCMFIYLLYLPGSTDIDLATLVGHPAGMRPPFE